ncbi:ester cyclase [Chryseosolibacter indicus]|uniref:Ester cyclase n=1 Tax=Chryseosolibacter indicus TaxID=2782351 RepID=A0ABS5VMD3_9BACT|nr:ester cyclase [Chryseosolibacter indicus]MBT1702613.1 ester cyclase [Chryseosolibacter indicus]
MDSNLTQFYQNYISCLNNRRLQDLDLFVNEDLTYNKKAMHLKDYQNLLAQNFKDIPDLYFEIGLLVANEDTIACRLNFNCTPAGEFMGVVVNGRRVSFSEHVFYKLVNGKISEVLSLIDREAIRDQID